MITQAKYEKIDHEFVKVVSALNHAKIKELCDKVPQRFVWATLAWYDIITA
jgi:hypothetical protein